MPDNKIVQFVEDVNEKLFNDFDECLIILEYWSIGHIEGITVHHFQLWNSEEEEFNKEVVIEKLNSIVDGLTNLSKTITSLEEKDYV